MSMKDDRPDYEFEDSQGYLEEPEQSPFMKILGTLAFFVGMGLVFLIPLAALAMFVYMLRP